MSAFGRGGNWESLTIVDTERQQMERLDEMWAELEGRQIERIHHEMGSPTKSPQRSASVKLESFCDNIVAMWRGAHSPGVHTTQTGRRSYR